MRRTKFSDILTTRPNDRQEQKKTYWIVDFAVPTDNRVKLKESKKRDKFLDIGW